MNKSTVAGKSWAPLITFLGMTYAVSWAALFFLRNAAQSGITRAFWNFILVTVWSPTIIAILTTLVLQGHSGVRDLFRLLFRRQNPNHGTWSLSLFRLLS